MADIRRFGDALAPDLSAAFLAAVDAARRLVPLAEIERLIVARDYAGIEELAERLVLQGLVPAARPVADVLAAVAASAARATVTGRLTRALERAALWSRVNSGNLITSVGEDSVQSIREVISRGIGEGIHPRTTAKTIRAVIGLTPRDAVTVANFRAGLEQSGASVRHVERQVERYAGRLVRARARMITRTETMMASHAGQYLAWGEAVRAGFLPPDTMVEWIVTDDDRLCERCEPMDEVRVPLGTVFRATENVKVPIEVFHPPLHPNCRCTVKVVF